MGKALLAHKMQVMYNLCSRFTNVRLAGEVAPGDATIAVIAESPADIDAFPPSGMLAIEGERIAYAVHTRDAFTGCVRGAGRTKPGHHPAGLLLCNSEALKQDILKVKDSPNLWGYWLVDDCRPFEGDCLKEMVRVMRQRPPPRWETEPPRDCDGHRRLVGDGELLAGHLRRTRGLPLPLPQRQAEQEHPAGVDLHHAPGQVPAARHRADRYPPVVPGAGGRAQHHADAGAGARGRPGLPGAGGGGLRVLHLPLARPQRRTARL